MAAAPGCGCSPGRHHGRPSSGSSYGAWRSWRASCRSRNAGARCLELYRQRQATPELAAQDETPSRADLESLWPASAGPDILAVLPELAGPEGYLGWAYEGFAAAHVRLASAVPGVPSLLDTVGHLVGQAGLEYVPAGLASATGTDGYLAVQERVAAAGQIDACRAWLDMGVRLTGILQGAARLPSPAGYLVTFRSMASSTTCGPWPGPGGPPTRWSSPSPR